jgi:hypothetical protein
LMPSRRMPVPSDRRAARASVRGRCFSSPSKAALYHRIPGQAMERICFAFRRMVESVMKGSVDDFA